MRKSQKNILTLVVVITTLLYLLSTLSVVARAPITTPQLYQNPSIDGFVNPGEYAFNSSFSGDDFILYWTISNDDIFLGMIGNALGYVSLGFDPSTMMKDSDMIIGWVESNTTTYAFDAYSTGNTGPHPPDVDLGGTADILNANGSETLTSTTIEVQRKLTTGDIYDFDLSSAGNIKIIWAISNVDNFDASHSARGSGEINFNLGTSTDTALPSLVIVHIVFMVLGYVLMITGIVIARFYKKKRWRIKNHRLVSLLSSLTSVTGIIVSFVMVSDHFRIAHHFLGVITLPFLVFVPIFGYLFTKNLQNIAILKKLNPYRKKMRLIHRLMGYLTFLLMTSTIITGIIRVLMG